MYREKKRREKNRELINNKYFFLKKNTKNPNTIEYKK